MVLQGLGLVHIVNRELVRVGKNLIKNSIFIGLRGEGRGGAAVYVADDSIRIENSTFRDNLSPVPLIVCVSSLQKVQEAEILNTVFILK
jgi:hypothetical protein